jgi:glycosyltransferase involved in cell wall biosynthesis
MRGAAVTLARMLRERGIVRPDLIIATDMLDLATFLGLTRDTTAGVPVALYMHENQLTYPLPPGRQRDLAFPWINYTACLAADTILFNSDFHRRAFLAALPGLTGRYHDHQELDLIPAITAKSAVLPPGVDLARLDDSGALLSAVGSDDSGDAKSPVILWNARWEYDKAPAAFFAALHELEARRVDFRVIVAGEAIDPAEPSFVAAREWLAPRTLHWGYAPSPLAYRDLLRRSDVVISTAVQEFFGISVIEAMYCGCVPVLPRRLSYPDLLPAEHHAACLYDEGDLPNRLQEVLADLTSLQRRDFRAIAAPYDWSRLVPQYDEAFERIAARSGLSPVVQ